MNFTPKAQPVKFFHNISDTQWTFMKLRGDRWNQVAVEYRPPTWCSYPYAVDPMGCWSLVGRMVTGEDYCKDCDLHVANNKLPSALAETL